MRLGIRTLGIGMPNGGFAQQGQLPLNLNVTSVHGLIGHCEILADSPFVRPMICRIPTDIANGKRYAHAKLFLWNGKAERKNPASGRRWFFRLRAYKALKDYKFDMRRKRPSRV
jgi:hypothetical protein